MVAKHESLEGRYGEIEETWSEKDKVTILQVVRELQEIQSSQGSRRVNKLSMMR